MLTLGCCCCCCFVVCCMTFFSLIHSFVHSHIKLCRNIFMHAMRWSFSSLDLFFESIRLPLFLLSYLWETVNILYSIESHITIFNLLSFQSLQNLVHYLATATLYLSVCFFASFFPFLSTHICAAAADAACFH